MSSRNYFITGAAGFIGSHLSDRLLSRGDTVVGLDNFDEYYDPAIKARNVASALTSDRYRLVRGDIRDEALVGELLHTHQPDVVVHLAARAGVRPSIVNPMSYISANIVGTSSLLQAAERCHIEHLVLASSSSVYGATSTPPFSEAEPADRPSSLYAATKRANEMAAYTYHHLYGTTISCLRFFTVYGPRQRPEMAIHKFTRLIDQGEQLPIFGNGSSLRDYTYIDDIVSGVVAAADRPNGFRIYNLGTTDTVRLTSLVAMISQRLGKRAILRNLPEQGGDVPFTHADISLAAAELDYQPTTDIELGLDRFIDWYRRSRRGTADLLTAPIIPTQATPILMDKLMREAS
jgi:UDP-glucuronate 4-epimerase